MTAEQPTKETVLIHGISPEPDVSHGGDVQLKTIRICLLTALPFVAVFFVLNFTQGLYLLAWVEAAMALVLAMTLWWSHHDAPVFWLGAITNLYAATLFLLLFFLGGISGIGYVWSLGFPFFSGFISGARAGLAWSIAYALAIIGFSAVAWQGYLPLSLDWNLMPYFGSVYAAFTILAYLIVSSIEEGRRLLQEAQGQLKQEAVLLAESEANHRVLLENSPNPVGVHRDGKWVYINPAAVELFASESAEEILGTPILDYIHPDYHSMTIERMQIQMKEGIAVPVVEEKLLRRNGETFIAEVQGSPVI
ncbi:MAG: PAS domain S-box protein, partial [Zetaproteobacteria bacterium]|nr:PAS domain S-box protein [Zetaproteobacteria bacterium]